MPRPQLPPELDPRRANAALAWSMQKQRQVAGVTGKDLAGEYGCTASHISRVEQGRTTPSRMLVIYYEDRFGCEGLLMSLYEVVITTDEQDRRRNGGKRIRLDRSVPGDASAFVGDTVPHGTQMEPGEVFTKTWTIRNAGTVPWTGRQLERQGPRTGPGLISSAERYPIADTRPGETVTVEAVLKAPTYDCASIAYFKMVTAESRLCFPQNYQLGLDVLVIVRDQLPDRDAVAGPLVSPDD